MVELDTIRYATAVAELTRWLRETDWDAAAARVRGWDDATWRQVPRALYLHTLVPWIVPILAQQPALAAWVEQHAPANVMTSRPASSNS